MSGPPPIRIVLWNDGGEALASGVEDEEQQEVLRSFAGLISDVIDTVLELQQFRHVVAVQAENAAEGDERKLSIGFDTASTSDAVQLAKLQGQVDISGLLLGSAALPSELASAAEVVVTDEEQGSTELQFSDESLVKSVSAIVRRTRLDRRYAAWHSKVEEALGPALDAASINAEVTETPMDPFDVLQVIVAQLIRVAGVSPAPPNLLSRGIGLVGGVLGGPRAALRTAGKQLGRTQRLWWRLEDVVLEGSKVAAKVAIKAARPLLIGIVLHRVLKTLDASRSLSARLARLPPSQRREAYFAAVLGPDWQQQLQEDLDKAVADVNEGLVTDEINHEKRLITAGQLRRLEVEEWDKQRMKNFYLASFGGLRWFDQMESALHNPLFIESRGWTDSPQNWVGENRTYMGDLPEGTFMSDVGQAAVRLKEVELGRRLTPAERSAILARGTEITGGLLPVSPKDPAAAAIAAGGALVPRA